MQSKKKLLDSFIMLSKPIKPFQEQREYLQNWNYKVEKIVVAKTFFHIKLKYKVFRFLSIPFLFTFHQSSHLMLSISEYVRDSLLEIAIIFSLHALENPFCSQKEIGKYEIDFFSLAWCFIMAHVLSNIHYGMCVNVCTVIFSPSTRHFHSCWCCELFFKNKTFLIAKNYVEMLCGKWHEIWIWLKVNKHGNVYAAGNTSKAAASSWSLGNYFCFNLGGLRREFHRSKISVYS